MEIALLQPTFDTLQDIRFHLVLDDFGAFVRRIEGNEGEIVNVERRQPEPR